jgi:uncharacterized protein
MKIFLDANILFSASYSDSIMRRLVKDLNNKSCVLAADRYVIEEALRNLSIHRPGAIPELHDLVKLLTIVPTRLFSAKIPTDINLPDKDVPVLAAAINASCDILMTGDSRHFGQLFGETIGGVTIQSPVDTARAVLGQP